MSYLPSSRLYEREHEPTAAPVPARAPEKEAPRPVPAPKKAPATVIVEQSAPAPLPPIVPPPIMPHVAPPPAAPLPKPMMFGTKEWLVAPAPTLHVETPAPMPAPPPQTETVTVSASVPSEELPGRKRNIFRKAQKVVLRHLDRAKNSVKKGRTGETAESGEPDLLWLAVMATGSLCIGLMIWGAWSALPRFGNGHQHLHAEGHVTRLKGTSEVPVHRIHESNSIRPQPTAPLHPITHHEPPLIVPHQAPPIWHEPKQDVPFAVPPPPVEKLHDPFPERKDPVVFVHANLGETPMIRTWKKLAETSLFLASFTAAASNNLLAQNVPQVDYSKQIQDLTVAVKVLSDQVANIKLDDKLNSVKSELNDKISKIKQGDNSTEFQILANKLDRLEKLVNQMAANPAPGIPAAPMAAAGGNLDEIKQKLGNIEQAILKLQPGKERIMLSPPQDPPAAAAKTGTHVILVNLYNEDLWLHLNQKIHRVPTGTTLTLDSIPAGPATVEVRSRTGVFYKANPILQPNEAFTLTAVNETQAAARAVPAAVAPTTGEPPLR